jgi:hypothetical protein
MQYDLKITVINFGYSLQKRYSSVNIKSKHENFP